VNLSYDVPFRFKARIDKVTIDLKLMEAATGQGNEKLQGEAAVATVQQDRAGKW